VATLPDLSPPMAPLAPGEAPAPAQPVAMRSISTAPADVLFHFDLLRSLQLHRRLFLSIVGLGVVLAAVCFFISWPAYVAESIVYIQPAPPRLLSNPLAQRWPFDENTYESYIQQQVNNVTRSDVLQTALKKLPEGSWQRPEESAQAAAERLGKAVKVERMGSSYQISITAKASDAAFAALIANTVATSFVDTAKSDLRAGDPERIKLLGEERERIQKALADDRTELEQVNKALGVAAVGAATPDPYETQITAMRADLEKARADHDAAGAKLTAMAATASTSSVALDAEADEIVAADPGLVSMKTWLNQRRAQLISQMANLTPNHPQYKQNADELAKINTSLESMMKDLRAKAAAHIEQRLRNDLERTAQYETRLNASLAQLSGVAGNASSRLQRANDLGLDIQRLQNRFTAVDEEYRNLTLDNKAPGAASITSPALPPLHPSIGRLLRNLVIVLVGALVLAIGAAVGAHNLDPRVYIATDIERVLGFSPMAQLPDFCEVSNGVADEYMLRLAAAIEHAYQQNGLKSCIVTAVAPGAGASTVASRVTTMLDGMGRSTVLVDASGTPPPPPAGEESAEAGAHMVTTRADGHPSVLLQQMAEEMDSDTIVLTDTAPLLASGETEYLARFVDSAIVVIQSGLTTRAQLREVAQTLQRLDVAAVGFVLNRVSIEKANPSFRQSVRAVEQRMAIQNRSHARRAPRNRPSAHQDRAEESPVVTDPEPVDPGETSAATSSSSEWSGPVPRDHSSSNSPDPSSPATTERPHRAASSPARPNEASAPPSRIARGRGEPLRGVPSPAQAAAPSSKPAPAAKPQPPVQPTAAMADATAPPRTAPSAEPLSESPRLPAAGARPAPAPPAPATNQPFPGDLASERDDAGYVAASRLSGLRNLLVRLGRRSLDSGEDAPDNARPDIEPRFERATVRSANPDTQAAEAPEPSTLARLDAQPEILPPKPALDEKEKEAPRPAPTALRRDPDGDDIQTLPSWRGQYRKKRYPPL
jgi:succinoglycan biosynthesis transport protein ExoP